MITSLQFKKLTPIDNADIKVYEDAIKYAFDNVDINNVAISGSYGSGKSSVLETYKKQHSDKKFIHISLAHFKSTEETNIHANSKNNSKEKKDSLNNKSSYSNKIESILEGKIINQLIHQISVDKIPQTIFRTKEEITKEKLTKCTAAVVILSICFAHMLLANLWIAFVETFSSSWFKELLYLTTTPYSFLFSGLIAVSLSSFIIYKVIQIQKNKRILKKLSVQGNEVEIFENTDDSYFDKYLNEVLYLFKNADVDAIVFEDLDRFDVSVIFERLKEINNLVNLQLKEKKKSLKFFYLIKDDIFSSKERTKFFDYIIPIVPIIDSSNSYDQIITHLKENNLSEKFNNSFLKDLSLYIDDMRILKNICNEFLIYYTKLNSIELDINKMFAIITYKNLFPDDYCNLQFNKGFVFAILNYKEKLAKKEMDILISKTKSIKEEINKIDNEFANSERELYAIISDKYLKRYSWTNKNNSELEEFLNNNLSKEQKSEYLARKEILIKRKEDTRSSLFSDLYQLEREIDEIKNSSIIQLLIGEKGNYYFNSIISDLKQNDSYKKLCNNEYFSLLEFLICHGFIDESYSDYMTYFYESSLSLADKIFLRSVIDRNGKPYNYKLRNPQLVLSYLKEERLEQTEILNFDLFSYILENNSSWRIINSIFYNIKRYKIYDFIDKFFCLICNQIYKKNNDIKNQTIMKNLINNLYRYLPSFFCEVIGRTQDSVYLYNLSLFTLYNLTDEMLRNANIDNCLTEFISNYSDYLNIANPDINKLIGSFKVLDVLFEEINYKTFDKELFGQVYENSLYVINEHNVNLMLNTIWGYENAEDMKHKNYSLIFEKNDSKLYSYVKENMSLYLDTILQNCDEKIFDNESAALDILNNSTVTDSQKEKYIAYLSSPISCLNLVSDTKLWSTLLNHNAICFSEENILFYFSSIKTIDTELVEYINNSTESFDFSKYRNIEEKPFDRSTRDLFFSKCVSCNEIDDQKYINIVSTLGFYYPKFDKEGVSDNKVLLLSDYNIIRMNLETLDFLRNSYPNIVMKFILNNIDTYVELINANSFSFNELLELLSSSIKEKHKISLLEHCNSPISIIDKRYSKNIESYILANNLDKNDINVLCQKYDSQNNNVKQFIETYVVENIDEIINNSIIMSRTLFDKLLSYDIGNENKVKLFANMISVLTMAEAIKCLRIIEMEEFVKIFDMRFRPRFYVNAINKLLLDAFKSRQWISGYKKDLRNQSYYSIERKGVSKNNIKK